nr:kinesin-like protein KIN12B [Ipomoea batatas]
MNRFKSLGESFKEAEKNALVSAERDKALQDLKDSLAYHERELSERFKRCWKEKTVNVWRVSNLAVPNGVGVSFPMWFQQVLSSSDRESTTRVASILYAVWAARSSAVWEAKFLSLLFNGTLVLSLSEPRNAISRENHEASVTSPNPSSVKQLQKWPTPPLPNSSGSSRKHRFPKENVPPPDPYTSPSAATKHKSSLSPRPPNSKHKSPTGSGTAVSGSGVKAQFEPKRVEHDQSRISHSQKTSDVKLKEMKD